MRQPPLKPIEVSELTILQHPLPFIEIVSGRMVVNNETARQLTQLEKPLVVVSIAGQYRTGKSYLMNHLAGKTSG